MDNASATSGNAARWAGTSAGVFRQTTRPSRPVMQLFDYGGSMPCGTVAGCLRVEAVTLGTVRLPGKQPRVVQASLRSVQSRSEQTGRVCVGISNSAKYPAPSGE